ncbi:hypothetical protein [Caudoviricetes sp.]|nr:hypothetical protein [Caudoviricetes sp.]UOF79651.1 hypothetical protein [Caudoviricetes sp.]UOF79874.1 hypothetical protein [Bacteriophage sp.]UOF81322.1 hypothetical protein [Caudoviricetes sp.]
MIYFRLFPTVRFWVQWPKGRRLAWTARKGWRIIPNPVT